MVHSTAGLLLLTAFACAAPPDHTAPHVAQHVLGNTVLAQRHPRKLKGRFLHITDFHPDPFYRTHTDPDGDHPCHQGTGDSTVGHYGAATTSCDSPFALVNATFKWIENNIKDEIDFVVWTGDSARHDNDDDIPRSYKQVEDLNIYLVSKFVETFGKTDNIDDPDPTNDFVIPIVPTYGNNDILPHNIFMPGPNRWTKRYLDIWAKFVPEEQRHSFARGGWFFTEVIPNKLAVISLNTLYFFDSNAAVDGCDLKSEPGYEHMEWLRIQLHFLRDRNMKAILMGHVPPARTGSKQSWDESCYQKYTLWQRQYRDVIITNIYGHMNIDHFMFQDVHDLNYKFKIDGIDDIGLRQHDRVADPSSNDSFTATAKATYINELRAGWAQLPTPPKGIRYTKPHGASSSASKGKAKEKERERFLKDIGGQWAERFSISIVSPSVVPNYFPTLRIIEYNITGLEHAHPATRPLGTPAGKGYLQMQDSEHDELAWRTAEEVDDAENTDIEPRSEVDSEKKKKKKKHKKKKKKPRKAPFPVPRPPSSTAPPGPAYSPQTLSLVSWTQFYANLTKIHHKRSATIDSNGGQSPERFTTDDEHDLENTFEPEWLINARKRATKDQKNKKGNKEDDRHFDFKVEYTTCNDSVYKLPDLTLRSWLDLAERIGRTEYPKLSAFNHDDDNDYTHITNSREQDDDTELQPRNTKVEHDGAEEIDEQKHGKHRGRKSKNPEHSGRLKKNHLWRAFVKRVFVQTKSESDLEDDFD